MIAHCHVVEGDCKAPAGIRVGSGIADQPMRPCYVCVLCGEPVCFNCSTAYWNNLRRRVCLCCTEQATKDRARRRGSMVGGG
jgi:hypothetical protein